MGTDSQANGEARTRLPAGEEKGKQGLGAGSKQRGRNSDAGSEVLRW